MIGFDRKIEFAWVDHTANLLLQGLSETEIREELVRKLTMYGLGKSKYGAISKTITILTRLWLNVFPEVIPLRDNAIDLYKSADKDEKVVINVCLAMANYPFFLDVLTHIGRLIKLQDNFTSKQISLRIVEKWGDTERVKRSVRHVMLTLKLWGTLEAGSNISTYYRSQLEVSKSKDLEAFINLALKISLKEKYLGGNYRSYPALFMLK